MRRHAIEFHLDHCDCKLTAGRSRSCHRDQDAALTKANVISSNIGQKVVQTSLEAGNIGAVFDTDLGFRAS